MASNWISYNELAWTEDFVADPNDYARELQEYIGLINKHAITPIKTLLHLGCGAGGHDLFFQKHYKVTGVDLSVGMLNKARATNPDIEYIEGDIRTLRLHREFDCVVIPDCIDYMVTMDELRQALQTSALHLKPGGVFLVVCKTKETFRNNNFAYTGEKDGIHVTVLENNYINTHSPDTYDITLLYLIRKNGELSKFLEESKAGLFSKNSWCEAIKAAGFQMENHILDGIYDKFLLENGEYPLTIFVGNKQ